MLLGVGCDIVEIQRIEKAMKKESFLRILTVNEKKIYEQLEGRRKIEWLAGRFAAKEAVIKAVYRYKPYLLSQIEIVSDEHGIPLCHIDNLQIEVSISHEVNYAIAYAVVMKEQKVCF